MKDAGKTTNTELPGFLEKAQARRNVQEGSAKICRLTFYLSFPKTGIEPLQRDTIVCSCYAVKTGRKRLLRLSKLDLLDALTYYYLWK
eukprot:1144894-Pelagomonas_calceolata.AAC.9